MTREVKIGTQVMFMSNSAEIDPRSGGLLSEVADVLARNPQVAHVQVQGHTDNRGDPEAKDDGRSRDSGVRGHAVHRCILRIGSVDARKARLA